MKKQVSLFALMGLLVLGGASCSKKYDCQCVDSNGGSSVTQVKGVSKDAAQVSCVAKSSSSSTYTNVCTLK